MSSLAPQSEARLLQAAAHIPKVVWWPAGQLASLGLAARPPKPLRQWVRNVSVATGRVPSYAERRAAQFSWLRNTVGSLQLGTWSNRRILKTVDVPAERLAYVRALHSERGVVLATPHMGSWDLCAAYATLVGLPVTSVAERLPAGQFEYFSALRSRLGMKIYPYDQPNLVSVLADDVRQGRVVALVADRDFGRRGLPVRWPTPEGDRELTLPAGPALIAQQTGAALVPITSEFVGRGLHITAGDQITHHAGHAGVVQMAQELTEFFARQIAAKPTDWHMMQKFFPGEAV